MSAAPDYEALKARAASWIAPISEAAPTGDNGRGDGRYESLVQEVQKLEALTGAVVAWPRVVADGSAFLSSVSKDLLVGAYVAHGLLRTQGLAGLTTGSVLLAELLDRYWDNLWPELKRLRGRVNAVAWFVEWSERAFPQQVVEADRLPIAELEVALRRLSEIVRERFQEAAPALGPLRTKLEQLAMSLPSQAPSAAVATATATAPEPPSLSLSLSTSTSAPPAPLVAPAALPPAISGDFVGTLRTFGEALREAAAAARRANPRDAGAYRVLRSALYLHMAGAPPAGPGGKTTIPALPDALRAQIETMRANGKLVEALEESESALERHRFVLDLHRISAECLAQLGPDFADARKAVLTEVTALLRRMPQLPRLQAANGAGLADDRTLAWIDAELSPAGKSGRAPSPGAAASDGRERALEADLQAEAAALIADGKLDEALANLALRGRCDPTARGRFIARLVMGEVAMGAGQPAIARAVHQALCDEASARGLDEWDPGLAARCLEGLLRCLRALGATNSPTQSAAVVYDRLCRLDPVAALRAGSRD